MNEKSRERLAEFAGFRFGNVVDYGMWGDYKTHDVVYFPQRTSYNLLRELPNFPESLDACFKWLVPKLYHIDIIANPQNNNILVYVYPNKTSTVYEETFAGFVNENNVALTVCSAIEKLIDGEK